MPPSWRNKVCEVVVFRLCTSCIIRQVSSCNIIQPWVNSFNSSKIMFNSLNVQLHLVWLPEIIVKKSAGEKFITHRINNKLGQILKNRREQIFSFEKQFQLRENVFVWKTHYSKSSSRNSESILMTYPFLFNNITLFISCGGNQLACFAKNRYLPGF